MKLHELKILSQYKASIDAGQKTFELRKNDRDYKVGDLIHFTVIESKHEDYQEVAWRFTRHPYLDDIYAITYVLKDVPQYGLDKDYCILGIKKLEVSD